MNIYQLIHGEEKVYDGLDPGVYEEILSGQDKNHDFMLELIKKIKPKLIMDLGSWMGDSAIHMASFIKTNSIDAKIVCLDTWLGPDYMIGKRLPGNRSRLTSNGMNRAYCHFLANVKRRGLEGYIIPFPQECKKALRFLSKNNIMFDMIYINNSEEYEEIVSSIDLSWNVLAKNGILFGRNYNNKLVPQFKSAVKKFIQSNGLESNFNQYKNKIFWSLKKKDQN